MSMTNEELKIHRELHLLRVAGIVGFDKKGGRRRRRGKRKRTQEQLGNWLNERHDKFEAAS